MTYKDKKVLVTGGAGFIGSALVKKLIDLGAEVTVIDDLFTGRLSNLDGVHGKYTFIETSIEIPHIVSRLVLDSQIVFHLAARNIIVSTKSPMEDYKTNIEGTLNILMASRNSKIEKLVYTSSASVYGNPRYLPINEDDSINLLTPYAVSKYTGEGYCSAFNESYSVPVTVLRLSNVYGPGQSPSNAYCGVVSKFLRSARAGEPLEIHGDGQSTRDFTYIDDVVDAIIAAGLMHNVDGEVLNVATGIETSINQLAVGVLGLYGKFKVSHIDRRDIDNIRRRVLNIEKIRRRLHWTPRITLGRGLETTKDWFDKTQV